MTYNPIYNWIQGLLGGISYYHRSRNTNSRHVHFGIPFFQGNLRRCLEKQRFAIIKIWLKQKTGISVGKLSLIDFLGPICFWTSNHFLFFFNHPHTPGKMVIQTRLFINKHSTVFLVGGFNPFETYYNQIGSFPHGGVKIKKKWNHHLVFSLSRPGPWDKSKKLDFSY